MSDVQAWPFLVVFPQKPKHQDLWEQYDDMVVAVLEKTKREYSVDPDRVYLTGLSQGGFGTFAIAAKHPDLFAAIAPICGGGRPEEMAPALKALPCWAFHGDADPVVKVDLSKAMVDAINAAGGNAKLTVYPGVGHNSWDKAYREEKLGQWFLQHRKGGSVK
ncbi:MAG: prolyl oligopeptidase family serine peptidase [Armatimonadota bacterium]